MRPSLIAASCLSFVLSTAVSAQALLNPPPPPVTETEQQLATIESVPQLLSIGEKYEKAGDYQHYGYVMERILQLRPHAGNIQYEAAASYAMQDNKQRTYDQLLKLKDRGYAFEPDKDDRFRNAAGTKAWDYILASFHKAAEEFGGGKVAFELPAGDLLLESLAYDPNRKQFLVGSMREGKVYLVKGEKLEPLVSPSAENGLLAITEIAVDAAHDALWVVSVAASAYKNIKPEHFGKSELAQFKLSDGSLVARHAIPAEAGGGALTSIALTPKGEVFVADGEGRRVFKLIDGKLTLVVNNPKLTSIRGMVVSGDGKILYLADYELGLFGLELDSGKAFAVLGPVNFTQFSIEGLAWYPDHLVVVQNGFPPARSMRLTLDPEGKKILRTQPLDAARKAFGMPTRGVIVDGQYYFIANSQKGQYDRYGIVKDASKLERPRVFVSDLKFGFKE